MTSGQLITFIRKIFNRKYNIYQSVNSLQSTIGMKLLVAMFLIKKEPINLNYAQLNAQSDLSVLLNILSDKN